MICCGPRTQRRLYVERSTDQIQLRPRPNRARCRPELRQEHGRYGRPYPSVGQHAATTALLPAGPTPTRDTKQRHAASLGSGDSRGSRGGGTGINGTAGPPPPPPPPLPPLPPLLGTGMSGGRRNQRTTGPDREQGWEMVWMADRDHCAEHWEATDTDTG